MYIQNHYKTLILLLKKTTKNNKQTKKKYNTDSKQHWNVECCEKDIRLLRTEKRIY